MIMIEIQYSGTALLLLHIPHRNNGTARPTWVQYLSSDALLPAMFNLLCSIMNQQLLDDFHNEWKPSCAYSTLFMESKDKWDSKEGTGKSMKNALHVQWCGKSISRAEVMSNSEKSSP